MRARILPGFTALLVAAAAAAGIAAPGAWGASGQPAKIAAHAQLTAKQAPAPYLSARVATSWQTNHTVWALAYARGVVYVGGAFTSVRPPGAQAGTGEVARSYLAAFNSKTGALLSFNPSLDGQVTALAVSPNRRRLYVGGSFTHADGAAHSFLAAFNTTTGGLVTSWDPSTTGSVLALAKSPDGSKIYVGGNFNKLDNTARTRVGEVDAATGTVLSSWAPNLNGTVTSIAVAPNGARVLVGGYFSQFNGAPQQAVVDVDPATGSTNNLTSIEPNDAACTSTVKDIVIGSVTPANPAGIAYIASEGTGGGCFDGDWAANVATGALVWQNDCLGATQALAIVQGRLYKGSHAHDCDFSPGGFPQSYAHRLLDQSLANGTLGHWMPNDNGNALGPHAMATDGSQLFVGGDFTTVNGRRQQGFARFGPGPDTVRPAAPGRPTVISTSRGVDSVTFSAVSTTDVGTLRYGIYRDGGTKPIATVSITSWPWALPVGHYRDAGLRAGSKHTYRLTVSNRTRTSAKSAASARVTVSGKNPPHSYVNTILRAKPSFFWQLNQASGTNAADSTPHGFRGLYETGAKPGAPGPITGSSATAASFNGRTGLVTSLDQVNSRQKFSIEGWFKTTSKTGGKIVGFGSSQTGLSGTYDRHVYMLNDGQVVFGVYSSGMKVPARSIESPHVYNDGRWHYVVATFHSSAGVGRMALYLDGRSIASVPTKSDQSYPGYWRVGGDNLAGAWSLDPWGSNSQGTTQPNSYYFGGTIGDVAVYPYAMSATAVAAHYAANARSH
jgi:hypothetical protein